MRLPAYWSARYLKDRARLCLHQLTHRCEPWLTQEATRLLGGWLEPDWVGLEWGAGRSTLWFAARTAHITSVEHDARWVGRVEGRAKARGLGNVTILHRAGDDYGYTGEVDRFEDGSLDFVLVDGLSDMRDRCALGAVPKIRPGGLLIVDDVHRYLPSDSRSPLALGPGQAPLTADWQRFAEQTRDWPVRWTSSGVTDTAIWRKPGAKRMESEGP